MGASVRLRALLLLLVPSIRAEAHPRELRQYQVPQGPSTCPATLTSNRAVSLLQGASSGAAADNSNADNAEAKTKRNYVRIHDEGPVPASAATEASETPPEHTAKASKAPAVAALQPEEVPKEHVPKAKESPSLASVYQPKEAPATAKSAVAGQARTTIALQLFALGRHHMAEALLRSKTQSVAQFSIVFLLIAFCVGVCLLFRNNWNVQDTVDDSRVLAGRAAVHARKATNATAETIARLTREGQKPVLHENPPEVPTRNSPGVTTVASPMIPAAASSTGEPPAACC